LDTDRITVSEESASDLDSSITTMIDPYKSELDAKMNRVIGTLTTTLEKARPEGTLNNWMTDIIHDRAQYYYGAKVDFTLQNYGGIRVNSIAAGDIVVRKIYELMPFDNKIVIVKLNGPLMDQMFDQIARNGGWPVSSSVRMTISEDNMVEDVKINGKPIDPDRIYTVALPDYVANGGGGSDFLKPLHQHETGWNVREAIIDYLENHNEPMSAKLENRIVKL